MSASTPIRVREYGSAANPTVVLLHGGPGAAGMMAPLGRALADAYHCLEPLQRPGGSEPLTVEKHIADLKAVTPNGAAIIGASWGAMLALSFTAAHPDVPRALALLGCGTYDEASRQMYRERMDANLGPEGLATMAGIKERVAAATDAVEREKAFAEMGALATRAQAFEPLPDEGEDDVFFDAIGHRETWDDAMRLQREGIEPARFHAIWCPVLMLHGTHDPHPGGATFHTLRRHIPHLTYHALTRAGHEPWHERHASQAFYNALRDWLRHAFQA